MKMPQQKIISDAITLLIADHERFKSLFREYRALGTHAKHSKKKIAEQLCAELTIHAEIEEQVFYPAIRGPLMNDAQIKEAIVEHASAKDLITQIHDMDPEDALYDAKVKVLEEQTVHHVDEEEADMFPEVRKCNIDLVTLGKKMEEFREKLMVTS